MLDPVLDISNLEIELIHDFEDKDDIKYINHLNSKIQEEFPNYLEDKIFGGNKRLCKFNIEEYLYNYKTYYKITVNYIKYSIYGDIVYNENENENENENDNINHSNINNNNIINNNYIFNYKITGYELAKINIDTFRDYGPKGQKYFEKLINKEIIINGILDFNMIRKDLIKNKNKIKFEIYKFDKEILENRKLNYYTKSYCNNISELRSNDIDLIINSDTLLNDQYFVDNYKDKIPRGNSKGIKTSWIYINIDNSGYSEKSSSNVLYLVLINKKYFEEQYMLDYLPYIIYINRKKSLIYLTNYYENFINYNKYITLSYFDDYKDFEEIKLYDKFEVEEIPWFSTSNFKKYISNYYNLIGNNKIMNDDNNTKNILKSVSI